ncbi:hypothetical protein [Paraflavitalea speifideaquila]|uniref:hypothetical protein n=1 Tax=Paraflavitalea speifideaquila TaxID=3076558 RepID=UPI0028F08E48|nr:hypothetical protein [Paraflavitalea speifideiaquila]
MFIVNPMAIDKDFIGQMKLQFVAGTGFTGSKSDTANILLNETAVREAGIKDPIGKWFSLWSTKCRIIGVVKDFHFSSLKYKIEPAVFYYSETNSVMYVKTTSQEASKAIAAVEKDGISTIAVSLLIILSWTTGMISFTNPISVPVRSLMCLPVLASSFPAWAYLAWLPIRRR